MTSTTAPESVQRFPLAWPVGWIRTPRPSRERGRFTQKAGNGVPGSTSISTYTATQRLERQVEMMGGSDPTLSTNVSLRLDGRPRSEGEPADPGVALYFRYKGRATVLACDRYQRVADNIAAIAAHVDALRRIERYGVGTLEQALAGYKALPADTAADWRHVFGFDASEHVTAERLQQRYRDRARDAHPDRGGSQDAMQHINRAREHALAELLT